MTARLPVCSAIHSQPTAAAAAAACPAVPALQPKQFQGIHQALYEREELRYGTAEGVGVDAEEVEVLVKELWHGYSARAPHPPSSDKAMTRSVGHLTLTRWVSGGGCREPLAATRQSWEDSGRGCPL
jgi:hypothetical protein